MIGAGKICPRILQPDDWAGWEQFKRDVQKELAGGETMTQSSATATEPAFSLGAGSLGVGAEGRLARRHEPAG